MSRLLLMGPHIRGQRRQGFEGQGALSGSDLGLRIRVPELRSGQQMPSSQMVHRETMA